VINELNIGIIDADLIGRKNHRFPNLACMKLSSYHRSVGDKTTLLHNYESIKDYNRVYISKVFTDTEVPESAISLPHVSYGGTGFYYDKAPPLSDQIEHSSPDYSLYDGWVNTKLSEDYNQKQFDYYQNHSIGFTTRGCIRQCKFCVNKNYKQCLRHSNVNEFVDSSRKYICLLDDNILSCKDWRSIFDSLNATGKRYQFKQGMDERLLTPEKCKVLFQEANWYGEYIFAFDNIKDKVLIENKLNLIREHLPYKKKPKFYTFCGFNHDDPYDYSQDFWKQDIADLFERINILINYNCLPYIMRYKDYMLSPYYGTYINLSRWCNQPSIFKSMNYKEFCKKHPESSSCYQYYLKFKNECPEIADKYYGTRWLNLDKCDIETIEKHA